MIFPSEIKLTMLHTTSMNEKHTILYHENKLPPVLHFDSIGHIHTQLQLLH